MYGLVADVLYGGNVRVDAVYVQVAGGTWVIIRVGGAEVAFSDGRVLGIDCFWWQFVVFNSVFDAGDAAVCVCEACDR